MWGRVTGGADKWVQGCRVIMPRQGADKTASHRASVSDISQESGALWHGSRPGWKGGRVAGKRPHWCIIKWPRPQAGHHHWLPTMQAHHQPRQGEFGRELRDRRGSCWTGRRGGRVCGKRGAACPPGACARAVLPLIWRVLLASSPDAAGRCILALGSRGFHTVRVLVQITTVQIIKYTRSVIYRLFTSLYLIPF